MSNINRRKFLQTTAAAAVAGPLIKTAAAAKDANETVNIAVIGIRGRGQSHYGNFARIPNVNIVTLCDVDERVFPEALARLGKITDKKPKIETDLRRVLD